MLPCGLCGMESFACVQLFLPVISEGLGTLQVCSPEVSVTWVLQGCGSEAEGGGRA